VARDGISAGLAGQELVISGEFTGTAKEGRALRRGRRSGRSGYRVLLPGQAEADKATAALADGVLTVTVPKTTPVSRAGSRSPPADRLPPGQARRRRCLAALPGIPAGRGGTSSARR
jgi:HSP20 family molecular chaperone IbpA